MLSRRPVDITDAKLKIALLERLSRLLGSRIAIRRLRRMPVVSRYLANRSQQAGLRDDHLRLCARGAQAMRLAGEDFRFCFLSGRGADSAEKSSILFARVKGRTENALTRLGRPRAWHFRPGYIHPVTAPPRRRIERWIAPLTPLFYVPAGTHHQHRGAREGHVVRRKARIVETDPRERRHSRTVAATRKPDAKVSALHKEFSAETTTFRGP